MSTEVTVLTNLHRPIYSLSQSESLKRPVHPEAAALLRGRVITSLVVNKLPNCSDFSIIMENHILVNSSGNIIFKHELNVCQIYIFLLSKSHDYFL